MTEQEKTVNSEENTTAGKVVIRRKKKTDGNKVKPWNDPIVRLLAALIALVIIGALLTLVFALANRSVSLSAAPQSIGQVALSQARAALDEEPSAENYQNVIVALSRLARFQEARELIDEARTHEFEVYRTQAIEYSYGYLLAMEGRDEEAITVLRKVMADLITAYDDTIAEGGDRNWAEAFGIPDNYFSAAQILATLYERNGQDESALEMLDIYLKHRPTAADILADRGMVKQRLGDVAGARKDFTKALTFDPENLEAQNGLAQVGDE